jgi:hypothetical protein
MVKSETALLYSIYRNIAGRRPARDEAYLERVRILPCCRCGKPESEPHHVFQSFGSLKTSDKATIPVCRDCHTYYHDHAHLDEVKWDMLVKLFEVLVRA